MGQVKHKIHEIIESVDTYQEAVNRVEEVGLGGDCDMLRCMWMSVKGTIRIKMTGMMESLGTVMAKYEVNGIEYGTLCDCSSRSNEPEIDPLEEKDIWINHPKRDFTAADVIVIAIHGHGPCLAGEEHEWEEDELVRVMEANCYL